ncbi:sterol desaturase family protein [Erythrobacteraceae bacterium E2-1 Yellow Sea]|nr:sterol desaturase family protein [Erythrobacteraceae bacterium E2-1 Yellow Sea]
MTERGQKSQRIQLFQNDRLELLTMISPRTFIVAWCVVLPLIAWTGWGFTDLAHAIGLTLAGLLIWGVTEYSLHRYIFHWKIQWPPMRWVVFLIHGNHHASPNDPMRNLMPLVVSLPIALAVWSGSRAVLGPEGAFMALGFLTGYVIYDTIHYACHQVQLNGGWFKTLKQHHMRHHYVDENRNFSISVIFWDRVFGTKIS